MALPGTLHVAKIALGFIYGTEQAQCENVFYVHDGTDAMFSDPDGFCDQVHTAAVTNLIPELFPIVGINQVGFEDVRSVPFGGIEKSYTITYGSHAATGVRLPANVAFSIKKNTGALGRSGRGRWYWPVGYTDALSGDSVIATASANNWVAALVAFQAAVEGGTYPCQMGIVSYQTGGAQRPNGFFQQITSWGYSDLISDSQRKRLPGRGA